MTSASLRFTAVTACLTALSALGGCETIQFGGVTGISKDAAGAPVAVLAICEGGINGLVLYTDDPEITIGEWDRKESVTGAATIPLAHPDNDWSATTRMGAIRPGAEYILFGGTRENNWATKHVTFSVERLATLRPGQVLTQRYDERTDSDVDTVSEAATSCKMNVDVVASGPEGVTTTFLARP